MRHVAPRPCWTVALALLTVLAPLQIGPALGQQGGEVLPEVRCGAQPAPQHGCLRGLNGVPGGAADASVGPPAPDAAQLVYAVGGHREEGATVAAFDAGDASLAWETRQPAGWPTGLADGGAWTVEVGPHGEHVVAAVDTRPDRDVLTAAYDAATGDLLWEARYQPPDGEAWPTDVALGPDGETVYVAADVGTPDRGRDVAVLAYETATGDEAWRQRSDVNGDRDRPRAIAAGPHGERVAVTGSADGHDVLRNGDPVPTTRVGTFVYDAATGDEVGRHLPQRNFEVAVKQGLDVAFGPEGEGVFVAAQHADRLGLQLTVIGLDAADARERWTHKVGLDRTVQRLDVLDLLASQPDRGLAVEAFPTGEGPRVVASGVVDAPFTDPEWTFVQVEPETGEVEQEQSVPQPGERVLPSDVEIAPDGDRMYGLGTLEGSPSIRAVDLRAGTVVWTGQQPGGRERVLALGPEEGVAALGSHAQAAQADEQLKVAVFEAGGPGEQAAPGSGDGVDPPAWPANAPGAPTP